MTETIYTLSLHACAEGDILPLAFLPATAAPAPFAVHGMAARPLPDGNRDWRVGTCLYDASGVARLKVTGRMFLPHSILALDAPHTQICPLLEALTPIEAGTRTLAARREHWALAWITLSDKGAAGLRVDESGPLMAAELDAFAKVLDAPARPLMAIIGGSKVSTKLGLLDNLLGKVDTLIVGGGIANTFLKAAGYEVGKSLYEPDLVESAAKIMEEAKGRGAAIPLPVDVVVGPALEEHAPATVLKVEDVRPDDMILDIGPATAAMYAQIIAEAGTVVWNGPVGAFEIDQFGKGTEAIAKAVAETSAYTVTGGGDSIAALEKYGYASQVDYISTAGGAFLEVLEGKTLPAVAALEARAAS